MFTIKNLDEIQDAGTYTCHAKNSLGEFKENFHLQGMFSCKIIAKKNSMIIDYFYGRCTYTSISFELLTFYSNKSPYHWLFSISTFKKIIFKTCITCKKNAISYKFSIRYYRTAYFSLKIYEIALCSLSNIYSK